MNPRLQKLLESPRGLACWSNPYLAALEAFDIQPNFYCSGEYFRRANWAEVINDNWVWVIDGDTKGIVLPPIDMESGKLADKIHADVWADLPGFSPGNATSEFLDYEYIYRSSDFRELAGGCWRKFRKNVRKFKNRVGVIPNYRPALVSDKTNIQRLIERWLVGLKDETVHGADIMLDYLTNGENRTVLVDELSGYIYGVNVFDYNYKFVNFRFCLSDPDPYLFANEYLRWLFHYCNMYGEMVNDGGALDRPGLKEFKDSLNPVAVRKVHSWQIKKS